MKSRPKDIYQTAIAEQLPQRQAVK